MSWLKAKDWATGVEYSSLFHSGLRAISLRPRARACLSSREESASGGTFLSSHLLSSTTRTRHAGPSVSTSADSSWTPPPRAPKRRRPSSMFVRPTRGVADTWSSGGMFLEIGDYPNLPEEERLCAGYLLDPDGVCALASFFVSLGEMDAIAVPPMEEESYLSLSNSPDRLLHHPVPRRERPVSMQTMPLPSSLHCTRETRRERGDCAWMLEESSPELKAHELGDVEEMRLDDERDWRQFHVDWVQSIR